MKSKTDQTLKDQVKSALARAIAASGVEKFSKAALVERFLNQGASRATLYRWIDAAIETGRPGQSAVRAIKQAGAKRAAAPPKKTRGPARVTLEEMGERLPAVVRVEDVAGTPTVKVIEELGIVVADLKAVVAHAKMPDGKLRNAKLLITASDRIRACLETAMQIHQAMRDIDQVDRLHDAILEEIGKEEPAVKERILRRLAAMASQYGA